MKIVKKVLPFVSLGLVILTSACATLTPAQNASTDEIKTNLISKFPNIPQNGTVTKNDIVPSLYEYEFNGQSVFTDNGVTFLAVGDVIDPVQKKSLRELSLNKKRGQVWGELNTENAIKVVYGNGDRKLAVFFDPDCPYCKEFEKQLISKSATDLNLTVYYFLYPLSIHPDAKRKSLAISCSSDPVVSFKEWILNDKNPSNTNFDANLTNGGTQACEKKVQDNMTFADKKYITGTPSIVFPDNYFLSGYQPIEVFMQTIADHNKK